jgi:tRNA threonylcarbamoyladenosine biosynthesis protein TsaB
MLLAIDTSTQTMGIALYNEPTVIGEMMWVTASHHTVELAPAVEDLLRHCSVQVMDLQAIAVALGPGSFTSLRIGLALAKGMSLSLHIPVIGIPILITWLKPNHLLKTPCWCFYQQDGRGWLCNDSHLTV